MAEIMQTLAKIRRYLALQQIRDKVIFWLAVGSGMGAAVLLLSLFVPFYQAPATAGVLVLAAVLAGVLHGCLTAPDQSRSARMADRTGLSERLITAWELRERDDLGSRLQREETKRILVDYPWRERLKRKCNRKQLGLIAAFFCLGVIFFLLPTAAKERALLSHELAEAKKEAVEAQEEKIEEFLAEWEKLAETGRLTDAELSERQQEAARGLEEIREAISAEDLEEIIRRLEKKEEQRKNQFASYEGSETGAGDQGAGKNENKNSGGGSQSGNGADGSQSGNNQNGNSGGSQSGNGEDETGQNGGAGGNNNSGGGQSGTGQDGDSGGSSDGNGSSSGNDSQNGNSQNGNASGGGENENGQNSGTGGSKNSGGGGQNGNNQNASGQSGNGQSGDGTGQNGGGQNSSGQGSGNGAGWNYGSNVGIEREHESTLGQETIIMEGTVGTGENLTGTAGEGDAGTQGGFVYGEGYAGTEVEYGKVVSDYADKAYSQIEKNEIPSAMQDVVKKYFEGLTK